MAIVTPIVYRSCLKVNVGGFDIEVSDSMVESRVLDTRKFWAIFECSKFRVIGPSNRASISFHSFH